MNFQDSDLGLSLEENADDLPSNSKNDFDYSLDAQKIQEEKILNLNNELLTLLREKDQEMKSLVSSINTDIEALIEDESENLLQKRYIDQVKKHRNLYVKYEKLRTENASLKTQLDTSQKQNQPPHPVQKVPDPTHLSTSSVPLSESQQQQLQDKKEIRVLQNKTQSLRNELQIQKTKMLKLRHILQKEIGTDDINLDNLIDPNFKSKWKGRAEQIKILETKIRELKSGSVYEITNEEAKQNRIDKMHKHSIEEKRKERMKEMDKIASEHEKIKDSLTLMKQQKDAALARNKTLSEEIKIFKAKFQVIVEKTQHDDELIALLHNELHHFKHKS